MSEVLDLVDYRRRVAESYARVRRSDPGEATWLRWRAERDDLFATHPQSPIEDRGGFAALPYFDYDPRWRTVARLIPGSSEEVEIGNSGAGSTRFISIGQLEFEVDGYQASLTALWLDTYGGGLFVPFRDATNSGTTYGGGRYLLDTVKGADLGHVGDRVVLDFNYAYHPSCVHSDRWSCPLAAPGSTLDLAVTAGERLS